MTDEQFDQFKTAFYAEIAEMHGHISTKLAPHEAIALYKGVIDRLAQSRSEAVLTELTTALAEVATPFITGWNSTGTTQISRES